MIVLGQSRAVDLVSIEDDRSIGVSLLFFVFSLSDSLSDNSQDVLFGLTINNTSLQSLSLPESLSHEVGFKFILRVFVDFVI